MIALDNAKKGGSVERRELGISRSDLVREALRQYLVINDHRRYIGEGDGYDRHERAFFYARLPDLPNSSQLKLGMENQENLKLLDREINLIIDRLSQFPNFSRDTFEGLREEILGKAEIGQQTLGT